MRKPVRHKRFTMQKKNDILLSLRCYCCAHMSQSIAPVGNENDSDDQRPDRVHT